MSFVSSLVGGIMGSGAANEAASVEAQGARDAQKKIEDKSQNSLDFQNNVWSGTQAAEQPYQALGSTSANALRNLVGTGFTAPTLADAENSPGFQFRLNTGTDAINRQGAATGTLMTGTQGKALTDYGQGLAESTYSDDYNRALSTYMANYQSLLGGTGVGLNSTQQLGSFGQDAANLEAGVNMHAGDAEAAQLNNAAAARASGYLGTAKAWGTAAGGMAAGLTGGLDNLDRTGGSSLWEQAGNFLGIGG